MNRNPFYTDMGPGLVMRSDAGEETPMPRYGVWTFDKVRGKHQVADCSDDLEALRAKFGEGPLVDMLTLKEVPDAAGDSAPG